MLELSLPGFDYKVKKQNGTVMIFDIVRKKYVVLTPEEWVRQHVVHYLVEKKGYAISRVAVEREIELYGLKRRFDIVVFDRSGNPWLLVECKAPAVALTQKVFDQVFRYNLTLAAPYVAITNGVRHFCGYMNQENDFCFLDDFPEFSRRGNYWPDSLFIRKSHPGMPVIDRTSYPGRDLC